MADRNLVLQLLITARDQASGVLGDIKTKLAALGAAIGGAFSIKEAATFEQALDKIRARADETGPALEQLIADAKEAAQTIGPEFGFSAKEAADGITELIAAGFSAKESIAALRGVLALARMENIGVAQAAGLVSDAITQFKLKATDASFVSDVLAKSAGVVAATAVDMGEALKYSGVSAAQMGMSLIQTSATLDVLAKAGQRGSEAGTGLASVLSILSNPAHAATQKLLDLGLASTQLGDVLDFLQQKGLQADEVIALFGEQAGRVIKTLIDQGGSKAIADFAQKLGETGKSAEQTAQIMQGNLIGAMNRFWESLKRVGIELASPNLPLYTKALDSATAALNTFASNDKIKAFQESLHSGFARIGDALSGIGSKVSEFFVATDWDGLGASAAKAFDGMEAAARKAWDSLSRIVGSLTGDVPTASSLAQKAGDTLKTVWQGLASAAGLLADATDRIASRMAEATNAFSGQSAAQQDAATGLNNLQTAQDGQAAAAQRATEATKAQTSGYRELWDALKNLAKFEVPVVFRDLADALGRSLAAARDFGNGLSQWVGGALNNVRPSLTLVSGLLSELTTGVLSVVRVFIPSMQGIADSGRAMGAALTTAFSGIVGVISAVSAGILKLTETVLAGWVEIGKLAHVISDADAAALQRRIAAIGESAGNMAALSARSFETAADAQGRFASAIAGADAVVRAAATNQQTLAQAVNAAAAAHESAVSRMQGLADAVDQQRAVVDALAEANQRGAASDEAYGAAVQKLWGLQQQLTDAHAAAETALQALSKAQEAAGASAKPLNDAAQQTTESQQKAAGAVMDAAEAFGDLSSSINTANTSYGSAIPWMNKAAAGAKVHADAVERVRQATTDAGASVQRYSIAWAEAADTSQKGAEVSRTVGKGFAEIKAAGDQATGAVVRHNAAVQTMATSWEAGAASQAKVATVAAAHNETINRLRENYERANAAYKSSDEQLKAGNITQQQATQIKNTAKDALNAYNRALEQNVENSKTYVRTLEDGADAALDAKNKEVELARSKGDTSTATQKAITLAQAEAQWAERVAQAKIAQIEAERAEIDAKILQKEAITNKTESDKAEIAALHLKRDALTQAADAAQLEVKIKAQVAQNAMTATDAINQNTRALEGNTDAANKNAEASKEDTRQWTMMEDAATHALRELSGLSDGMNALVSSMLRVNDVGASFGHNFRTELGKLELQLITTNRVIHENAMTAKIGYDAYEQNANIANAARKAYLEQAIAAYQLADALKDMTENSKGNASALEDMTLSAQKSADGMNLLDQKTLDHLKDAIEEANQKLRDMQDEAQAAQDRLAELDAEIAAESGDTARADQMKLELERTRDLASAEAALSEARAAGNREAAALYEQQIQKLEKLYTLKLKNLAAEQQSSAASSSSGSTTSATSSNVNRGEYTLNLTAGGTTLAATTAADPTSFLNAIAQARRSAA